MNSVYCCNEWVPAEEAKISIFNRGFLFGDGVFTTLRVDHGKIGYLSEHLAGLQEQCRYLSLDFPEIKESIIYELIDLNKAHKGVWRLKIIVACSEETLLYRLPTNRKSSLIMTLAPYEGLYCHPVRLCTYPYAYQSELAKVKSLAYLERMRIKQYALTKGYDDAVVYDPQRYLLETGFANIFWKDEEGLHIPDKGLPYYFGITLKQAIKLAEKGQLPLSYEKTKSIPYRAQVFMCNSMAGICPVIEIDGMTYSRDPVFEKQFWESYNT